MRRWLIMLLMLALPAFAQEAAPEAEPAPDPESGATRDADEASEAPEAPTAGKDPRRGNPDVFVPSEQISEDLAVPFPVDV